MYPAIFWNIFAIFKHIFAFFTHFDLFLYVHNFYSSSLSLRLRGLWIQQLSSEGRNTKLFLAPNQAGDQSYRGQTTSFIAKQSFIFSFLKKVIFRALFFYIFVVSLLSHQMKDILTLEKLLDIWMDGWKAILRLILSLAKLDSTTELVCNSPKIDF